MLVLDMNKIDNNELDANLCEITAIQFNNFFLGNMNLLLLEPTNLFELTWNQHDMIY